jgi:hypothetical protein
MVSGGELLCEREVIPINNTMTQEDAEHVIQMQKFTSMQLLRQIYFNDILTYPT